MFETKQSEEYAAQCLSSSLHLVGHCEEMLRTPQPLHRLDNDPCQQVQEQSSSGCSMQGSAPQPGTQGASRPLSLPCVSVGSRNPQHPHQQEMCALTRVVFVARLSCEKGVCARHSVHVGVGTLHFPSITQEHSEICKCL